MSSKHLRISGLALVLVIAAIAVPSASARPAEQFLNSQPTTSQQSAGPSGAVSSAPTQVRVAAASPAAGFDWGDAGIGAGAAFALTMIGLGGAVLVSNRRHAQTRPATTA